MAGPWEQYQQPIAPADAGPKPWERYAASVPAGSAEPLVIDIVGGTRESALPAQAPAANNSDFARMISGAPAAAEPPIAEGNAVTRFLGEIGGRQVLQGVGGLYGALGGDALNHYVLDPIDRAAGWGTQLGTGGRSYRDAGALLADELGMRRPETAQERIYSDIGEALTGTALTMGAGGALNAGRSLASNVIPTAAQRLGEVLSAQPVLQTISTATGAGAGAATREGGGGQGAQILAALAGGLGPAVATSGSAAALRGAFRGGEANRAALAQSIDDFATLGATPSVGQGTGSWARQGTESLLTGGPTSGGVMRRFAEGQSEQIGDGLRGVADNLFRNASGERAGRAIERGVETFAKNTAAQRKALYWQVDQHIPGDAPVSLANTQRALADLTTPITGAEATTGAMISPKIQQLADNVAEDLSVAQAAGTPGIPYEAVKQIRSKIGEELSDFALSNDRPTAQLKQLYASLSSDLEQAAAQQGPAAVAAVRRANTYFRASADRLENLERIVDKNGGPEKVFQAAMSGTRDGATTLRAVMRSLPADGQKAVSAAVIKRMGLAAPGAQNAAGDAFSANTFLTNWSSISQEARRTLFGRFGDDFSRDMDKIARVAETIKSGSEVFKNPSGTANRGAALAYPATIGGLLITGQAGPAGAAVLGGLGANAVARLMTNPRFVKFLARSTELPLSALPAQINVLKRQAAETQDDDVAEVANALSALGEGSAQDPQAKVGD